MSDDFDPNNPFGGPTRKKMDFRMVELMLAVVDNGRELLIGGAVPSADKVAHIQELHKMHALARGMVWRELARRRKRAQEESGGKIDEHELFEDLEDDEDDEDEFEL